MNVAAVLACVALASATPHATPIASAAVFRRLVLERIRAYGRGDVATYVRMLAPGFVHVSDRGERRTLAQMRAYVSGHGEDRATFDVAELAWRREGDLAIVDALVREHRADIEGGVRETDVFVARDGAWRYLRHHETARLAPPTTSPIGDDRIADYVGRYRSPTGTIDVITATTRTLFDRTLPDATRTPFVHVARGTFGFADDPTLAVFLRDRHGAVVQCLFHLPSGQTVLSRRIR